MRTHPNIIITGTPGVGKTTTCDQLLLLSSLPGLRHLSINTLVKDRGCHEGFDEAMQTFTVDEDALLDEVEKEIEDGAGEGGWLIDWHACDLFPRRWVDLVVVLRCERTDVLWDRLKARDYPEAKLQENLDAEIFGVLAEEAREAYDEGIVVELKSETVDDVDANCERILEWVKTWQEEHGEAGSLQKNGTNGS